MAQEQGLAPQQGAGLNIMQVAVRDNNIDAALRILKKKMQREGVFRQVKENSFYSKPSEIRIRDHAEAIRRSRKLARKKAERDGLLPRKKPKLTDKRKINGSKANPSSTAATPNR